MKIINVSVLLILIIIVSLSYNSGCGRYQVSSFGNIGAIVIDTITGEAWVAKEGKPLCGDQSYYHFVPASYFDKQFACTDGNYHVPDQTRDKYNIDWWTWFKQLFNKKNNKKNENNEICLRDKNIVPIHNRIPNKEGYIEFSSEDPI